MRKGRFFVVAAGVVALGGIAAFGPNALVGIERMKLERDFEYFFEIADTDEESIEGRAIVSFLSRPANQRVFVDRLLSEAASEFEKSPQAQWWSSQLRTPAPPTGEQLADPTLRVGYLVLSQLDADEAGRVVFRTDPLTGSPNVARAKANDKIAILRRWLPRLTGSEGASLATAACSWQITEKVDPKVQRNFEFDFASEASLRTNGVSAPVDYQFVVVALTPHRAKQRMKLIETLRNGAETEKASALRCLVELEKHDEDTASALLEILGTFDGYEIAVLARWNREVIWRLLTPIVDAMLEERIEPKPRELALIKLLGERAHLGEHDPSVTYLAKFLAQENDEIAAAAATELGRVREHSESIAATVDDLLGALTRSPDVRRAALEALWVVLTPNDTTSIEPLVRTLREDEHADVRAAAAQALSALEASSAKAVPALLDALGDAKDNVRCAAADALGAIGPAASAAAPALEEAQEEGSPLLQNHARWALVRVQAKAESTP